MARRYARPRRLPDCPAAPSGPGGNEPDVPIFGATLAFTYLCYRMTGGSAVAVGAIRVVCATQAYPVADAAGYR